MHHLHELNYHDAAHFCDSFAISLQELHATWCEFLPDRRSITFEVVTSLGACNCSDATRTACMQCEFLSEQHAALHAASCTWNFQGARLHSQHPYAVATAQINMSILAMKKFLTRRSVVESLCRIVCE